MDDKEKKNDKSGWELIDLLLPVIATGLAIYYLISIQEVPTIGKYYGTALSILIFVCMALVLGIFIKNKVFLRTEKFKELFTKKGENGANKNVVIILLALITVAYIILMQFAGFVIATFIYTIAVQLYIGRRGIVRVLVPAIIVTLLGYILFAIILNLKLPLDSVTQSLKYTIRRALF